MTRLASLVVCAAWLCAAPLHPAEGGEVKTLVDFSAAGALAGWQPVDDVVMGGVSRSRLDPGDGAAIFSGELSLAFGGGFASVRGPVATPDFSACQGLELRFRGDGKVYRLRLHDTGRFDGVAWQARFSTRPGRWQTLVLRFSDFEASFRGRRVPDAPPLRTEAIRQAGLMIAEKQAGAFRLEVAWIRGQGCGS